MPAYRTVDDIQLGDLEFWKRPLDERLAAFEALRSAPTMCFHEEITVVEGGIKGPGFWSAVNYDDVRLVNRTAQSFSSAQGITSNEAVPETLEFFGSMIVLDDPRHAKMRLLVQKGFTPKMVAQAEGKRARVPGEPGFRGGARRRRRGPGSAALHRGQRPPPRPPR